MKRHIYRVVTKGPDGTYRIRDYMTEEEVLRWHVQVGVDDCSTDMSVRGRPILKGLIGPMPDTEAAFRYESPEVFEQLTKIWSEPKHRRRVRRKKTGEVAVLEREDVLT